MIRASGDDVSAIKWEAKDARAGEWRAWVGKFRLREWPRKSKCGASRCPGCPPIADWQQYDWAIEGHECRVLASGGAPTRKVARVMAEAAAHAAVKAGLR